MGEDGLENDRVYSLCVGCRVGEVESWVEVWDLERQGREEEYRVTVKDSKRGPNLCRFKPLLPSSG